ncbi:MAG: uroporphyrinogen-III synthase [Synechococcus sp.]
MTGPLAGRTVMVTRAQEQQGEGRQQLEQFGAQVIDLPALTIGPPDEWGPLDDALQELDDFHWVVFSSANGVRFVEERLRHLGRSLTRRPGGLRIAAVGRKTAALLEQLGAPADFVPPDFVADSLIDNFPVSGWGLRLLIPRVQSGGRTLLAEAFGDAGARVVEVAAYESRCPERMPDAAASALESGEVAAISFSSSKTVSHTAQLLEGRFGPNWRHYLASTKIVSIGPQTSQRCQSVLGRVDTEAQPHDMAGLVKACIQALEPSRHTGV